jgi:hypothetical protein
MPKKKVVKLSKEILNKCPSCGKPKAIDSSIVTAERMHYINEVMQRLEGLPL